MEEGRQGLLLMILQLLTHLVTFRHNRLVLLANLDGRSFAHVMVSLVLALCTRLEGAAGTREACERAAADFLTTCLFHTTQVGASSCVWGGGGEGSE